MTPLDSPTTPQSPLTSRTALLCGSGVLGMISGVCLGSATSGGAPPSGRIQRLEPGPPHQPKRRKSMDRHED